MSENNPDMFGPFKASIRNHLGEFADKWMEARIKLLQKLNDQIAGTSDLEELKKLRAEVNDALISVEDISKMDAKLKAFLEMLKTHTSTFLEIRGNWEKDHEKK
jgi:hypothetical protein